MAIESRFGTTHIVVSGPAGAPPLVLLHGYMATLLMWGPNIAVNSFMRWLGFNPERGDTDGPGVFELMYLGMKHFRIPQQTLRVVPAVFSDEHLRSMRVPTMQQPISPGNSISPASCRVTTSILLQYSL
jgi:hypothetical protein